MEKIQIWLRVILMGAGTVFLLVQVAVMIRSWGLDQTRAQLTALSQTANQMVSDLQAVKDPKVDAVLGKYIKK